jgi:4-methyl-5(b-hydroxyethyl)-thiazole monophosphate biosynthesis
MNKNVYVFMATGFEEMELTISVDILRRAGMDVKTVSLKENIEPVLGSRGIKMIPDCKLSDLDLNWANLIILPGGLEGTKNLGESETVLQAIKEMNRMEKWIAAICAAPAVLTKAGILVGKTATSHPAAAGHMPGVNYSEDRVVVDGRVITSRAAGTTFEFAFKIIEEMLGEKIALEVNKGVLAAI